MMIDSHFKSYCSLAASVMEVFQKGSRIYVIIQMGAIVDEEGTAQKLYGAVREDIHVFVCSTFNN